MYFTILASLHWARQKEGNALNWQGTIFSFGQATSEHTKTLLYVFFGMCLLGMVHAAVKLYTLTLFPLLSQSIGGGQLELVTYVVKDDTIQGRKIYATDSDVFLKMSDSSVLKIKWDDVNRILVAK